MARNQAYTESSAAAAASGALALQRQSGSGMRMTLNHPNPEVAGRHLIQETVVGSNGRAHHIEAMMPKGGLPRHRLLRVLDYIRANLTGNLSIAELAAIAGMSPHYFAEMFRRSTGRPPHQFVLLQRIEHAKDRLCDRRYSVIEAALDAGFQNPSHFARTFRRLAGTSPSEFQSEADERTLFAGAKDQVPTPETLRTIDCISGRPQS
jgi:AraC-like DNA-binding protein